MDSTLDSDVTLMMRAPLREIIEWALVHVEVAYASVESVPASKVTPEMGEIHRNLARARAYLRSELERLTHKGSA